MENSNNRVQIGLVELVHADYPAASDFLNVLYSLRGVSSGVRCVSINMSGFCDPAIDARMHAAMDGGGGRRRQAAALLWAGIDRDLTERAPSTTLFQIHWLDLVSARVGNFRFSPLFHMIFSREWVQ